MGSHDPEKLGAVRPSAARWQGLLARMMAVNHVGPGALVMLVAGSVWAVFCATLARGGHAPAHTLLPIARQDYYARQAWFVTPVLILLWAVCVAVTTRMARMLGGTGAWQTTASGMAIALAAPLLFLFLAPDWIVYQAIGFSGLKYLLPVTAPLSFVSSLALATLAVREAHGLNTKRAFVAGASGVLAQTLLSSVVLR